MGHARPTRYFAILIIDAIYAMPRWREAATLYFDCRHAGRAEHAHFLAMLRQYARRAFISLSYECRHIAMPPLFRAVRWLACSLASPECISRVTLGITKWIRDASYYAI